MENIIHFVSVNPWSTGFTFVTFVEFVYILFCVNGAKEEDMKNALFNKIWTNIFVVFMILLVAGCIALMTVFEFTSIVDKNGFMYWVILIILWGLVQKVTDVNLVSMRNADEEKN